MLQIFPQRYQKAIAVSYAICGYSDPKSKGENSLTLLALGKEGLEVGAALYHAKAAKRYQIGLASECGSKLDSFQEN
ncbi:hypothetical protein H6G20_04925 [Desertifilum sp. FACHB-1129]|uniref:Uncharacterized protein n=2 Tax=Desertifilum tharense IPPAS B-1220 TaxID=1781255 RepID=A0A1E5QMR5_9CYAN|nr:MULTISPECIES: hypothetical protein [Desertifilum]MDA0208828.1 hypothetical protein [Cyanobacteria bacterium FC1]MBD2311029.1 hypothetical protein [Desertifilum sp. FACHB-1129]MBD2321434.1 hypothetical protein [Desertifilum sp. FACHB-866]MBD2331259.1 hypothetical protein [Desertifilum sp. FACHB-868]OEJ75969.1 hypothetical protein BH720_06740 [Desertifilum tharense IPPAS B-1220]